MENVPKRPGMGSRIRWHLKKRGGMIRRPPVHSPMEGAQMKNLMVVVVLLMVVTIAVGVYRGWFMVNREKLEQDEQALSEEVQDLGKSVRDKAGDLTSPAGDNK